MVLELAHKLSDTLNNEKEFKLMVSCYGNLVVSLSTCHKGEIINGD